MKNIWNNFKKICILRKTNDITLYKAKNIKTGMYFAIKEINKEKFKINLYEEQIKKMGDSKNELIKKIINTENNLYLIMDLCLLNLEEFIKKKERLSIDEIREILFQLNESFKYMNKMGVIHGNIKLSNILIFLNHNNQISFIFCENDNINLFKKSPEIPNTCLTNAPEILNGEEITNKSDIWSLGIIIYYMLNKEKLFVRDKNLTFLTNIDTKDEELNDLLTKMLKLDINERISWDDYFRHPFFINNMYKIFPTFNLRCKSHFKPFNYYCIGCKKNICQDCLNEHSSDEIVLFSEIGLSKEEKDKAEYLLNNIEKNLQKLNEIKKEIENIIENLKLKFPQDIYTNEPENNFKKYYIDCLEILNEKCEIKDKINLLNINDNYIPCKYNIEKENLDKPIQILNHFNEKLSKKKGSTEYEFKENEKDLKEICEIYINDEKIDFSYEYYFKEMKEYMIKFKFNRLLDSCGFLFYDCSLITSLNLSNFYTNKVKNMSHMFSNCSSLNSIDLSNFNTNKVTNMSHMFSKCSSLKSLDLSNFNTKNVTDMNSMFYECSSLNSLDLSNFDTNNVTDMNSMFSNCSSLNSIDLSNFDTNKVTDMNNMFSNCSSLKSLDLSNFNTKNVNDMNNMFFECASLNSLDLSNFDTNQVTYMNNMFFGCSSLTSLDLSNFDTKNVTDMNSMFFECSLLTSLNISKFNTNKVKNMNSMFFECSSLNSLDLLNFITNNVSDMNSMFFDCCSLNSLDLSNFDTNNVTDMNSMFYKCSSLISLDLSNFNTKNVTDMNSMFYECSSLNSLDLSNFDTNNVTDMNNIFDNIKYDCNIISNDEKINSFF